MKKTLYLIALSLFVFTTLPLLSTASDDVIYDAAGNKLLTGVSYYILPLLSGTGGGLTLSRSTKDACPLEVTQEPFELNYGVPFIFTPIVVEGNYVSASYPISIQANVADPCQGSTILTVSTTEPAAASETVTIGGVINTPESCFQLVEDDMMPGLRSYQIQLCPFKCGLNSSTSLTCYNIGVTSDPDGTRYLATTDVIFPVVFQNLFGNAVRSEKR